MQETEALTLVETDNWPFAGVYLYDESIDNIVQKLAYAYDNNLPVYLRYEDFKKDRDLHQLTIFSTNIGYVHKNVDRVNGKPIPTGYACIHLAEFFENKNMSPYGLWSKHTLAFYENKVKNGLEYKSWINDTGFVFPDIYQSISYTIEEE